jgi:glucosamine-phosphate N-acetyltransferase
MALTPDQNLDLLFDPALIPTPIKESLAEDVHVSSLHSHILSFSNHHHSQLRPLSSTDLHRGHLSILRLLTQAPDPANPQDYVDHFNLLKSASPQTYFTVVLVQISTDQVIGVGTLVLERKFLRNFGKVGHIEDIAVSDKIRGKGLGKKVIEALTGVGESLGCYKCILDCSKDNIGSLFSRSEGLAFPVLILPMS